MEQSLKLFKHVQRNFRKIIAPNIRYTSTTGNELPEDDMPVSDLPNPFEKEKVQCILCKHNITPNYKNIQLLSQFQSPYTGRIYGKHITGLCTRKQKEVEKEIIKAQNCGLMPYYHKMETFLDDPKLFKTEKPIKPHKY